MDLITIWRRLGILPDGNGTTRRRKRKRSSSSASSVRISACRPSHQTAFTFWLRFRMKKKKWVEWWESILYYIHFYATDTFIVPKLHYELLKGELRHECICYDTTPVFMFVSLCVCIRWNDQKHLTSSLGLSVNMLCVCVQIQTHPRVSYSQENCPIKPMTHLATREILDHIKKYKHFENIFFLMDLTWTKNGHLNLVLSCFVRYRYNSADKGQG